MLTPFNPDLLISDLAMPGTDGYTFMRQIRTSSSEYARIPSIAVSAYAGAREAALAAGYDDYLPKPILADQLFAVVRSLAERTAAPLNGAAVPTTDAGQPHAG
jgi:CheY-like chemotaxis protein